MSWYEWGESQSLVLLHCLEGGLKLVGLQHTGA